MSHCSLLIPIRDVMLLLTRLRWQLIEEQMNPGLLVVASWLVEADDEP
jgi:hypothetical protein